MAHRTFDLAPDTLRRFVPPRKDCQKTEAMSEVIAAIRNEANKVVHIHGMSGSGKSQIVANACQEMECNGYAVWHAQCRQGQEELKSSWRYFARHLQSVSNEPGLANAMSEALEMPEDAKRMKAIWQKIRHQRFQILLAVELEDADDQQSRYACADDIEILKSYVKSVSSESHNVTLVIASRNEDILFTKSAHDDLECYKLYKVSGMTEKEAQSLLESEDISSTKNDLSALARELAYSPLGLRLAKSYCAEFRVSYGEYYNKLGKDAALVRKEKELLKSHPDLGRNHRYEIIMKLLRSGNVSQEEKIEFTVLQMLSFLHKNSIPRQIIERFFQRVNGQNQVDPETAATHLIRKLEKRVDCTWDKTDEGDLISLHGDILRALQTSIEPNDKVKLLKDVMFTVSPILDKDNRTRKSYGILYLLKNHISEVALRCAEYFRGLGDNHTLGTGDYEVFLCLSRVNELIGFSISQHPGAREHNEEDGYFEKAMECLWDIVAVNDQKSALKSMIDRLRGKKIHDPSSVIRYEEGKDEKKTAYKIFEALDATRNNAELNRALYNDYVRNFPLKESDLQGFKTKAVGKSLINWDDIEKELSERKEISDRQYEQLVKSEVVLDWKVLSKYYLAERMASILHSRGRQDNYKRDLLSQVMIAKCLWWVNLGFHICDIAAKKTGIKSLFHFMLRANNKLHKLSVNRDPESDADFNKRILDVRDMVSEIKEDRSCYYEHGKYRVVSGTAWTIMSASKYLIKVNTKVHKRPALLVNYPFGKANQEAADLFDMAVANPKIVLGTTCLVHVGKYYAAREDFDRAFDAFEKAFASGIEAEFARNPTRFAWALYNELRAVTVAPAGYRGENLMRDLERRVRTAKSDSTPKKWRELLDTIRTRQPSSDRPPSPSNVRINAENTPAGDL